MCEMAIFDPLQNRHPLTDHQKFFSQVTTSATPTAVPNYDAILAKLFRVCGRFRDTCMLLIGSISL